MSVVKPYKTITDIDLSNNSLLSVSHLKGPVYDVASFSKLPRTLNISTTASTAKDGILNIFTDSDAKASKYKSSINIYAGSLDNKITLEYDHSGAEAVSSRTDTHDNLTANIKTLAKLDLTPSSITATPTALTTTFSESISNTAPTISTEAKTLLSSVAEKHKANQVSFYVGAGVKEYSSLPNIEVDCRIADGANLAVDTVSPASPSCSFFLNAKEDVSFVKLNDLEVGKHLNINNRVSFTNISSNRIVAQKKLDIYTPVITLRVKESSPPQTVLDVEDSKTKLKIDESTVNDSLTSTTSTSLSGTTTISPGKSTSSKLEVTTGTVYVGKQSTKDGVVDVSPLPDLTAHLNSGSITVEDSTSVTLKKAVSYQIAKLAAKGSQKASFKDFFTNSLTKDESRYISTITVDKIDIPAEGSLSVTGTSTLDATGKSATIKATSTSIKVENNKLNIITADSKNVLNISADNTTANKKSSIKLGNTGYGSDTSVVLEYEEGSASPKKDPVSRISSKDASFGNLTVRTGATVNASVTLAGDLTFTDLKGDKTTTARIIKGSENLDISADDTINIKPTLKLDEGSKIVNINGTEKLQISGPSFNITAENKEVTVEGSQEKTTVPSSRLSTNNITATSSFDSQKSTSLAGTTSISGESLESITTLTNISSSQVAIGNGATVKADDTVSINTKTVKITATKEEGAYTADNSPLQISTPAASISATDLLSIKQGAKKIIESTDAETEINATKVTATSVTATSEVKAGNVKATQYVQIGSIQFKWDAASQSLIAFATT